MTEHVEGDPCKFALWVGRTPTSDNKIVLKVKHSSSPLFLLKSSFGVRPIWVFKGRTLKWPGTKSLSKIVTLKIQNFRLQVYITHMYSKFISVCWMSATDQYLIGGGKRLMLTKCVKKSLYRSNPVSSLFSYSTLSYLSSYILSLTSCLIA